MTLAQEAMERMRTAPRVELDEMAFFELLDCPAFRTPTDAENEMERMIGQLSPIKL